MTQDTPDDLRQQVEFIMEFLEWSHGMALRNKNVKEARAYYTALGLVEDALDEKLDPAKVEWTDRDQQYIDESREAREDGVKAATLHELAMERYRERSGGKSLVDRLLSWRST